MGDLISFFRRVSIEFLKYNISEILFCPWVLNLFNICNGERCRYYVRYVKTYEKAAHFDKTFSAHGNETGNSGL